MILWQFPQIRHRHHHALLHFIRCHLSPIPQTSSRLPHLPDEQLRHVDRKRCRTAFERKPLAKGFRRRVIECGCRTVSTKQVDEIAAAFSKRTLFKMMNWRQIYGDEEFSLKAPVYWSDIIRRRERRQVNVEDLKQRAVDYAKSQCQTYNVEYAAIATGASIEWPPMKKEVDLEGRVDRDKRKSGTVIKTETSESGEHSELPPGWATAKDANGRVYYWHKGTKATQWNKPVA